MHLPHPVPVPDSVRQCYTLSMSRLSRPKECLLIRCLTRMPTFDVDYASACELKNERKLHRFDSRQSILSSAQSIRSPHNFPLRMSLSNLIESAASLALPCLIPTYNLKKTMKMPRPSLEMIGWSPRSRFHHRLPQSTYLKASTRSYVLMYGIDPAID